MKEILFSKRLAELIIDSDNISTDKLGQRLGLSGALVRLWRLGKSLPSFSNIINLSDYFHCSIDYLLGRSDVFLNFEPQFILPIFGNHLTELLHERKITWYRVVKDTKIANSNLSDWRGAAKPLLPTLIVLADYLDVTIDYLVGREL